MALIISVVGPDSVGSPTINLRASGDYAPDVMSDLVNRAVETYLRLFDELIEMAPVLDDADDTAEL